MLRTRTLARAAARVTRAAATRSSSSTSSAGGGKGGGGKFALIGVVGAASVAGGTLGYAAVDGDFRKLVESNVPGAKDVFSSILGPQDKKPDPQVVPSKLRPPSKIVAPPGLPVTKTPSSQSPASPALSAPPLPPIEEPPKVKEPKETVPEKKKLKKTIPEENVEKLAEDMKVAAGMAVLAAKQSCEAIANHGKLVVEVLEQDVDHALNDKFWHEIIKAAAEKTESERSASERIQAAQVAVEKAKVGGVGGPEVSKVEEKIRMSLKELEGAKKESYVVEKYRDLVEEGRQAFRKEIGAILPEEGKASEEEINLFITHAYKTICNLQQKLAKTRMFQANQGNKEEDRLEADYKQRVENEVRSQLRLQAMAHQDHIKDALEVQELEMGRKYSRRLDEALADERAEYRRELGALSSDVRELKQALKRRADLQRGVKEAQELWLACCSLQRAVGAERPESGVLPLAEEVATIKKAVGSVKGGDEEFVNLVLESLPQEAVKRGVYTDQTLRDRFFKVEKMAKRTALVGEEGGSLLLYLLSYIQSFFILTPSTSEMPDPKVPIDIENLSTFDIVWLARGSVERGDLEQAIKYMTLLKGEPKKISSDWIREARLLLATKQVCDVLLAHAAAFGLESFPNKV